jgi:hypothetical protein
MLVSFPLQQIPAISLGREKASWNGSVVKCWPRMYKDLVLIPSNTHTHTHTQGWVGDKEHISWGRAGS